VILKFNRSPSITNTGSPIRSTTIASSVTSTRRASLSHERRQ
jgi:hypothetical protein